jgi:hypothetical protein
MTQEKFRELLNFLSTNHHELFLKFPHLSADNNGFYIQKNHNATDEEFDNLCEITNKWRDINE